MKKYTAVRLCLRALWLTLGFAVLLLLTEIGRLASWDNMYFYHYDGEIAPLCVQAVADLLLVWFTLAAIVLLARRGRPRILFWAAMLLALPWIVLKDAGSLDHRNLPHALSVAVLLFALVGALLIGILWRPGWESRVERGLDVLASMFGFLSISGTLIVVQMLYCLWTERGLNQVPMHAAGTRPTGVGPPPSRVVVILFDELSFQQVFGRRSAQLQLPAFDALGAQGTVFGNVRPAASVTELAVPSLLTGQKITQIRPARDGRTVSLLEPGGWTPLNPVDTLFGDAVKAGYRVGVSGWYIPYCRIMSSVLDRCDWHATSTIALIPGSGDASAVAGTTLLRHLLRAAPVAWLLGPPPSPDFARFNMSEGERHIRDFKDISRSAEEQLADPSLNFVYLHLPLPHMGGIYDRRTGSIGVDTAGSYLNNLALADRYLGHLRELLQKRDQWDSSTLIVLGDHSWRTWLSTNLPEWTAEDNQASDGGRFDDRPALIVKLPHQDRPGRIPTPFEATRVRAMVHAILNGRIQTADQLSRWATAPAD